MAEEQLSESSSLSSSNSLAMSDSPIPESPMDSGYFLLQAEGIGMPSPRHRPLRESKEDPQKAEVNSTLRQARKQLKEEGKSHSPENFIPQSLSISTNLLTFLKAIHSLLFEATAENVKERQQNVSTTLNELFGSISRTLDAAIPLSGADISSTIFSSLLDRVSEVDPTEPKILDFIINAVKNEKSIAVIHQISENVLELISMDVARIQATCVQLVSTLQSIADINCPKEKYQPAYMQAASLVEKLFDLSLKLFSVCATYRHVVDQFLSQKPEPSNESKRASLPLKSGSTLKSVWSENSKALEKEGGGFRAGTLNHIINILTSVDQYDNKFLKTFITTYQSFTTPEQVIEKLMERYRVPSILKRTYDHEYVTKIQLRVGVAIQQWIKSPFFDMSDEISATLEDFAHTMTADGHNKLGETLLQDLKKKMDDATKSHKHLMFTVPPHLNLPENNSSPLEVFLSYEPADIAKQLCLIEFDIFRRIKSFEFLDQSWNKPHRKHKSLNVLEVISRMNKISFWTCSMILWQSQMNLRIDTIKKFIKIGKFLRQHNNYGSLMGIIAGLNLSYVSRLKATLTDIPIELQHDLKDLQTLLDPSSSFKNYRDALRSSSGPTIPYLGMYLTDLTFSEDGNPDNVSADDPADPSREFINWSKRELISTIIMEINLYQQTPYNFSVLEPVHTFLLDLPHMSEKDMQTVSLKLESKKLSKIMKKF